MERFLIDNNVLSRFLSGELTHAGLILVEQAFNQVPIISVITQIEALSWVHSDKKKERIISELVQDSIVIPLSDEIVSQCIRLRRGRKMKTPDAIIAATAIAHDLTLLSFDQGFEGIAGLKWKQPI